MNLIKSGRIGLSTAWGSMHTDFMGGEELNRMCYDYTKLNRSYGVSSELAKMDDVPGHPTLDSVRACTAAGRNISSRVRTFLSASPLRLLPAKFLSIGNRRTATAC